MSIDIYQFNQDFLSENTIGFHEDIDRRINSVTEGPAQWQLAEFIYDKSFILLSQYIGTTTHLDTINTFLTNNNLDILPLFENLYVDVPENVTYDEIITIACRFYEYCQNILNTYIERTKN